ncbi:uncharacterized protein P174DRAFT_437361 [Aspergillus novofumigatus IBT 16806]|uniref:Uncharacterized protein n=1 Tax=Aspergillus novofumigatus (strain IBT 16806) TaxID=1392255 RepID=A0A2I1CMV4_ASPN1|nr:uncharacterized protein P174DRAFT_437361 [Aspergillus novofumigatus IBT 16806]PKX98925.1 hypothetical protein P174DRAFT_437361 [Aspergillus novofumigatus IBT 16806]
MSTEITFDVNGLYILLSDRGENSYTFHWALYLHQAENSGYLYHLINESDSTSSWRFDPQPSQDAIDSQRLLVALNIGVLEPTLHQALLDRLRQIPIAYSTRFHENITSRVWLKEALFALDDEGYIKLTEGVNDIEAEATNLAMRNKIRGTKTVARSSGSQA